MPAKVKEFMTPGGSVSWNEADGIHFTSRSAFPGAEVLSGQVSPVAVVGVTSMSVAILLPSLSKARELANRSYDAANERGIIQSAIIWSMDNGDQLPDHVGRLLLNNQISPKMLVSKRRGTAPLELTPAMLEKAKSDFDAFAKEVDAHCDYVYLGKGGKNTSDASQVLIYEKPGPHATDGINIGFADGHVDFTRWANVAETFRATNEYLKKNKLPEVDVEAILKEAPGATRRR
jgi:prepilin-type processing-associated H-X9-DG protein